MADQPLNHETVGSGAGSSAGDASAEDALLKAALHDVPLPNGLASRLKAHMRAQYETPVADGAVASASSAISTLDESNAVAPSVTGDIVAGDIVAASIAAERDAVGDEQAGNWLRRSILLAALAAGISGFAYLARQWTRPTEPSWLASQCDLVLVQIDQDNPANWQPVAQPIPAAVLRVQSQLVRVAFVAERPLAKLGSQLSGNVYRLDAGDGRGIFLMRFESLPAIRGLTSRFEILPTPSGGWSLVAMTTGKETFVLAAACTEQQIFAYIRRPDLT